MSREPSPAPGAGARRMRVLATFALLALPACASRPITPPAARGDLAGMAPTLSVERFLQAANAKDFAAMAKLFGTHEGPISGDPRELELRMSAIAEILHHDDYHVVGQSEEPGRQWATTRIGVDLTKDGEVVPDVPFLVVRTGNGQWLVEQIDLEKITRRK